MMVDWKTELEYLCLSLQIRHDYNCQICIKFLELGNLGVLGTWWCLRLQCTIFSWLPNGIIAMGHVKQPSGNMLLFFHGLLGHGKPQNKQKLTACSSSSKARIQLEYYFSHWPGIEIHVLTYCLTSAMSNQSALMFFLYYFFLTRWKWYLDWNVSPKKCTCTTLHE